MKKRACFLSLLVASFLAIFVLASCKKPVGGGSTLSKFDIKTLTLWGKDIKGKEKISLDGTADSKVLSIVVTNCDTYKVEANWGGIIGEGSVSLGVATITFADNIPEGKSPLAVKLSADGMQEEKLSVEVNFTKVQASDLEVLLGDKKVIEGDTALNSTLKSQEIIKIKTTKSQMTKVTVDGKDASLDADGKTATYTLDVTGTQTSPQKVSIEVKFKYLSGASKEFKVAKFASEADIPLSVISAKVFTGSDYSVEHSLEFSNNKAKTTIKGANYSTVKLEMKFDQEITTREVKSCKDERPVDYTSDSYDKYVKTVPGYFSGYIVADVDAKGVENRLEPINKDSYTEILIVGFGTVTYEIEITAKNGKKVTYTIEIKNGIECTFDKNGKPSDVSAVMGQKLTVENGASDGWLPYVLNNGFHLPYYNRAGLGEDGSDNFKDLEYIESLNLNMIGDVNDPFCFYYNVMEENGGTCKDEHKFNRIISTDKDSKNAYKINFVKDIDGKYLDCFASGKETLPSFMLGPYYGKKWKKIDKVCHPWTINLLSAKKLPFGTQQVPVQFVFAWIFNYRVQAKTYEKQKDDQNNYLTISKNQKFTSLWWWPEASLPSWNNFLTPASGDTTDGFFLKTPNFDIVKEVKYTIKKGDSKDNCTTPEAEHNNVDCIMIKFQDGSRAYLPGGKAGEGGKVISYKFEDNKVYKIEVTITYKDNKTDTFRYCIDYTNTEGKVEPMNWNNEGDDASNLFGVPMSYDVKMLEPSILKGLAN